MASNPAYTEETGAIEVATAYSAQASGKTILITGVSTGGIGDATARAFAHGGASTIIITGRNDEKLFKATNELSSDYPKTRFLTFKLDLDAFATVRQAAREVLDDKSIGQIDIIVTNAGASAATKTPPHKRMLTVDGIEWAFATNHLAHFLFVALLLPKLRLAAEKNAPGATRVVALTSAAMITSPFRFSDYNFDGKPIPEEELANLEPIKAILGLQEIGPDGYEPTVAYGQSKTANTLFALHLSTLFSSKGIYAFAVHPGLVQSSGMGKFVDKLTEEQKAQMAAFGIFKNIDQGAATTIVAALDPSLKPEAGVYLADCQIGHAPGWATDKEKAEKLWKLSEELVGEIVKI